MDFTNLRQPPHNTTLMGMVEGALRQFGSDLSTPMIYGGSGHAFALNIHEALCPSGPYCFDREPILRLLRNLGLEVADLGFFHGGSGPEERAGAEMAIREALDGGAVCGLVNMEFQLITGADDTGFRTAQPWPMDFPPGHLTSGTWAEFGAEVHVNFFAMRRTEAAPPERIVAGGLGYAVDLYRNPRQHSEPPYGAGPEGYARWVGALRAGHGGHHGAWWNGTVWSECRARAADFFDEVAELRPSVAPAAGVLAAAYREISGALAGAADRERPAEERAALVEGAAAREARAIREIAALAAALA